MRSYILIVLLSLLSACTTVVPVTQKFPEAPGLQSSKSCKPLKKLPENATLSQVAEVVSSNYDEYWACSVKLDAWIEWYQKQELIHKGLK